MKRLLFSLLALAAAFDLRAATDPKAEEMERLASEEIRQFTHGGISGFEADEVAKTMNKKYSAEIICTQLLASLDEPGVSPTEQWRRGVGVRFIYRNYGQAGVPALASRLEAENDPIKLGILLGIVSDLKGDRFNTTLRRLLADRRESVPLVGEATLMGVPLRVCDLAYNAFLKIHGNATRETLLNATTLLEVRDRMISEMDKRSKSDPQQ